MPDVLRLRPLQAGVDTYHLHLHFLLHPEFPRQRLQGLLPENILLFMPPAAQSYFVDTK
jgi:hypothetical protein